MIFLVRKVISLKRTLYSLMLSDDVVREVDRLAHRMGTNRSSLVNRILAEYVDYTTPERRINEVFTALEELLSPSGELVPFFAPNAPTMSMKSSLEYKYRPTVKYEVELTEPADGSIGTLTVLFRTQSASLIDALTRFFRLWKELEDAYLAPRVSAPVRYALYDGRFVRSLDAPQGGCSSAELARALSDYVQTFDALLKGVLSGRLSEHDAEREYLRFLQKAEILL